MAISPSDNCARELGSLIGEGGEFAVDVADLDGQRIVGVSQAMSKLLFSLQMRRELVVECRLLLERLEFEQVELVDLLVERGHLVHQRLGLARGDHGLHLLLEPLTVSEQFSAALLCALDRTPQLVDPGPQRSALLLPAPHLRRRAREIVTQGRVLTAMSELIGLRIDSLKRQEQLGNGGWFAGRGVRGLGH